MSTVILYRKGVASAIDDHDEMRAIKQNDSLRMIHRRSMLSVMPRSVVIARYALWPFVAETIADIEFLNATPINDTRSSLWLRRCGDWAETLRGLTPDTWDWNNYVDMLRDPGAVVLKGEEKSCGHRWNTHMLASHRQAAVQVFMRLMDDSGFENQEIYVRRYVPLRRLALRDENFSVNRPPCSEEYRIFVLDGKVICSGFYWSSYADEMVDASPRASCVPESFIAEIIRRVHEDMPSLRLWVMDVARTEAGDWIVVELNDGCTSGLSDIKPDAYYSALARL